MEPSHEPTGGARVVRVVSFAAKALGILFVFTVAAGGGAVLHLGMAAPRRFIARQVNGILASTFEGKIIIQRVGVLRLNRLDGVDAEVQDPEGQTVLVLRGVRVRIGTLTLVRSLVGHGPLIVGIPELTINGAEVVLEQNPAGELGLSRAFDQRDTTPGGRGMNVSLPEITLTHAWIHGHMAAVPIIDGDLKGLAAAFEYSSTSTHLTLNHVYVVTRALPRVSPEGTLTADVKLGEDSDKDRTIKAQFNGHGGDIPLIASASVDGKTVSAVADIPKTRGDAFDALAAGAVKLTAPVDAHVEVKGELPVVEPKLIAHVGDGQITASAIVTLPDDKRPDMQASASLSVEHIDLQQISPDAPKSDVGVRVEATAISRPQGKVSGTFHVESVTGHVAGQVVPPVNGWGELTETSAHGVIDIAEVGAPTEVRFWVESQPGTASFDQARVDVRTTVPDLNAVARAGHLGQGRVRLSAQGTASLETKTFQGNATIDLSSLALSGVKLSHGVVTASAAGAFSAPHVAAKLTGAGAQAAGYSFPSVLVGVNGTPSALDVIAELDGDQLAPTVGLKTHVTHATDLALQGTQLRLARNHVSTVTTIGSIQVAGSTVDVRDVRMSGLGDPITATARLVGSNVTVRTKATDIDLARVAVLLAREEDAKGHMSFDIDASGGRGGVNGRVDIAMHDLSDRGINGAAVDVSTKVSGRHVDGKISAHLGDAGNLDLVASNVLVGGAIFEPRSWQTATGAITIDGKVDLKKVLAQIPADARPLHDANGVVALKGAVSHPAGTAAPTVTLNASTNGLSFSAKQTKIKNPDGTFSLGPEPLAIAGFDGSVDLSFAPTTGRSQITAKLRDAHGPAATLEASATLPLQKLTRGNLMAQIGDIPITAKLTVPSRSLDTLPASFGKTPVKADVEVVADVQGTARAPKVAIKAKALKLIARDASSCVAPIDVALNVAYDGSKAKVDVTGTSGSTEVLSTTTTLNVRSTDLLAQSTIPWDASADVALDHFPLEAVAPLIGRHVAGDVSGKMKLADLHKQAVLEADIDLHALALDKAQFPKGKIQISTKDGALKASVRVDQADGSFQTDATGKLTWGAELAPKVDLGKGVDVEVKAKNFRADAAMPFVAGTFSELDGRLDTDAKIHIGTGSKDSKVTGAVALRDGSFEVPQLGERFHGLSGKISMSPWGTLKFDDFVADGPSGHLSMSGNAVLKGIALDSAAAQIHIAKGHSIPIALEGVSMGRAFGDVKLTAKMAPDGKKVDVGVDVAMLRVDLPQSTGHSVQALDLDKTIRVGVHTNSGDFVTIPLVAPVAPRPPSDMAIHASVKLGREIQVKRDTTVDVTAGGSLDVLVTDKAHVTGKINVERGKFELEGKQFTIDRATVSFLGDDVSNPMVIATAYWDAPDSTRVYADFSGLVSQGKLTLRSEPALAESEILSLILFGSADGSFGSQPPPGQQESTGAKAAGMAGGVLTQGLDKAISGVTSVDISTRVDTSEADDPEPELAVQIAKTVSARIGYKLGVPAPGENPDRTELTLDWRFIRNWSLVAVVGDQGSTALDVVWRMRY